MRSQLSETFSSTVEVNNALYVGNATGWLIRDSILEEDPARPGGPGLPGKAQNPVSSFDINRSNRSSHDVVSHNTRVLPSLIEITSNYTSSLLLLLLIRRYCYYSLLLA